MGSAKLFYNGRSQAVRLPWEYRFDGEDYMDSRKQPDLKKRGEL